MRILTFIFAFITTATLAQTTFTSTSNGAWESCSTWGTCPGSVAGVDYPGRDDNAIINHTVTINNIADNGSAGVSPNSLPDANVATFNGSGSNMFYQTGDITINVGGTLNSTVRIMVGGEVASVPGSTAVYGTLTTSSDLVNLGRMDIYSTATFSCGDDFILSGDSETDMQNSSVSADDIYIDHTDALLCGSGDLTVNDAVQYFNSATISQICAGFTITCTDGNCGFGSNTVVGTGMFTLPIEVIEFIARENELYWDVIEYDIQGYEIQYTVDFDRWETIGSVDAYGNDRHQYTYPVNRTGYYRLKTIEELPNFSDPVLYRTTLDQVSIYPTVIVTGQSTTATGKSIEEITVLNANGIEKLSITDNFDHINFNLEPGMYIVKIKDQFELTTKKLIIR